MKPLPFLGNDETVSASILKRNAIKYVAMHKRQAIRKVRKGNTEKRTTACANGYSNGLLNHLKEYANEETRSRNILYALAFTGDSLILMHGYISIFYQGVTAMHSCFLDTVKNNMKK
ncbi:MAG: hypothetical protein Q8O92_12035 [Candidatus Latescibacter sp.]|nr:hypothetical protein [Candidatus Latescibacter sp.]